MAARDSDPYVTLDVSPGDSDDELHTAYRRLVKLHHPDHNGGSAESARRFEAIQDAYAQVRRLRGNPAGAAHASADAKAGPTPAAAFDPDADGRLAEMERQIREAHLARERARLAAREAAAAAGAGRPSDEELGYVTTDDSFSKILADARSELSTRFADAREHPVAGRVADLIDELASRLTGDSRPRPPR
jgi:curved DNA-binding protein CbpA